MWLTGTAAKVRLAPRAGNAAVLSSSFAAVSLIAKHRLPAGPLQRPRSAAQRCLFKAEQKEYNVYYSLLQDRLVEG